MSQPTLPFGDGPARPGDDARASRITRCKWRQPQARGKDAEKQVSTQHIPQSLPPSRRNAPPGTSEVAASMIAREAPGLRDQVYAAIAASGADGRTDDEGETITDLKPQTYTPRRRELVCAGLVEDSGRRRPTITGRPAAVWIIVDTDSDEGDDTPSPARPPRSPRPSPDSLAAECEGVAHAEASA